LFALVGSRRCGANFSVKEKDEASPFRECGRGFVECLHSPFCRGVKALYFWPVAMVCDRRYPVKKRRSQTVAASFLLRAGLSTVNPFHGSVEQT
jgi:hypothetical protein